jgi:hypothetical protein
MICPDAAPAAVCLPHRSSSSFPQASRLLGCRIQRLFRIAALADSIQLHSCRLHPELDVLQPDCTCQQCLGALSGVCTQAHPSVQTRYGVAKNCRGKIRLSQMVRIQMQNRRTVSEGLRGMHCRQHPLQRCCLQFRAWMDIGRA